uniref:Omp-1-14 n=1 Tax=Ehrlichia ewingii TaxID=947 RepID=B1N6B7_9RICK|nr:Omp-1-14 [Ehrlichia ewingii]
MNYNKILVRSALISLMTVLPYQSFADPMNSNDVSINDSKEGFYISAKYSPSIPYIRKFSAVETPIEGAISPTKKVLGLNKGGSIANSHDFSKIDPSLDFHNNLISGFSGSIGYAMDGPRIEIEATYQKFHPKNPDNNDTDSSDHYKYYGLFREGTPQEEEHRYVVLKNEGLTFMSLTVNACYDIVAEGIPFIPYACVGIGSDLIDIFNDKNLKFAYQGKVGISYPITSEVSAFIGGYYHGIIGNKFNKLPVKTPVTLDTAPQTTSASVELDTGFFGGEIGVSFSF